jgi:uncharacterized radical SAM superfamily protein
LPRIKAFRMKKLFTVVSLTGGYCELNCSHCQAKYIRSMLPAPGPRLPRLLEALWRRGVRGVLLSGGWTRDAVLPVEPYLDTLADAKKRLGLVFNIHLGLETRHHILERVREFADIVDYEFTLNRWMVQEVRGLRFGPERYLEALDAMLEAGLNVVPHVFLWHPRQSLEGLRRELREVEDRGIEEVNLLVYIPPEGDIDRRTAEKLPVLAEEARSLYGGRIYLGCMRPRSARKILDPHVIENVIVERIANPSLAAERKFRDRLEFYDACCSIPEQLLPLFRAGEGRRTLEAGVRDENGERGEGW